MSEFLTTNYVESDTAGFSLMYPKETIQWALGVPGRFEDWLFCIRKGDEMIGMITGVPRGIVVKDKTHQMIEVNFLCVSREYRSKRLAPILIKEITRRAYLRAHF